MVPIQSSKIDLNKNAPFDQAYWVIPDRLMAGYYPGSALGQDGHAQLRALLRCGIRHFLNLMQPDEIRWYNKPIIPYEAQTQAIARELGYEVSFDRLPIKDMGIPTRIDMARILDRIDHHIENGEPVYVHCLGGVGRTGTVIGCYLARHGYASGRKVLELIQQLRRNTATRDRSSPESKPQIDLVLSWVEGA
ncbi:MAG: dual specificity protein phosphatase family protein [Deltaproteobacteria bacterium]|jgi:hypothetical protein|nr:dual specificity protein phosphatase family protein [Deltaproteobacteria bacterium]